MSKKKAYEREAELIGDEQVEVPGPAPKPKVKYFVRGHREGYSRDGYKFSATVAPFPGEPTAKQKADRYLFWYHADKGEAGRQVRDWERNDNSLDDNDRKRRAADNELRAEIKAQNEAGKDNI